jgi:hypothetical protein
MLIETTSSYPLSSKTKENSSNFPNKKYICKKYEGDNKNQKFGNNQ